MNARPLLKKIYKWEYIWLCLIVLATLALHFAIIYTPKEPILDEIYYVNEARSISDNQTILRQEHPPLGKLIILGGVEIFGDNTLGWRFFSVVLGTGSIVIFYFLCRRLNLSNRAASIATFLLAFENMTFIQNSVAMLDVFYLFFMFAAWLLYLNARYINAGIAAGLSVLAKLFGALSVPAMIIHWFFTRAKRSRWFALTVALSVITFIALLPVCDLIIHRNLAAVPNPITEIKTMLSLTGSLTFHNASHPSMARPWEWVINPTKIMPFWYDPHYNSMVSPSVWVLIIPAFAYLLYLTIKKRDEAGLFGLAWFASTYLIWIPLVLITDRITYPYYFYPSVGAICLGIGMGLSRLIDIFKERQSGKLKWTVFGIVVFIFLFHIVSFIFLYPAFPMNAYNWVLSLLNIPHP